MAAGIDSIAQDPRALADAGLVVDAGGRVHRAVGHHAQHRAAAVEAEVHGHPPVGTGVGERAVHGLPVGDGDIARVGAALGLALWAVHHLGERNIFIALALLIASFFIHFSVAILAIFSIFIFYFCLKHFSFLLKIKNWKFSSWTFLPLGSLSPSLVLFIDLYNIKIICIYLF